MTLCLHHNDHDGLTSGAIVKHFTGCETYEIDYSLPIPFDKVKNDEKVFIVDFSLEVKDMDRLFQITEDIIWIDHHISAIKKLTNYQSLDGIREDTKPSAAALCWQYFNNGSKKYPDVVKYVTDFDTWTFDHGDTTKDYTAGMMLWFDMHADNPKWKDLFDNNKNTDDIIELGQLYNKFNDEKMKKNALANAFIIPFEGLRFLALNTTDKGSFNFDGIKDFNEYDAMMTFRFSGGQGWSYSLYSDKDHVKNLYEIAGRHGGGGHPQAAGFETKDLVLDLTKAQPINKE